MFRFFCFFFFKYVLIGCLKNTIKIYNCNIIYIKFKLTQTPQYLLHVNYSARENNYLYFVTIKVIIVYEVFNTMKC